jgi:predicted Zn-dependent peptidase
MKENIQETRLENGLTVLTEEMTGLRSATLGVWLRCGSRHEPEHLNGICHFIEHTVFKGTKRRSALEIAIESDRLGGNFDAFTMHEQTGFSLHVVDNKIVEAFDLLADILTNPLFDEAELKREQRVIIEEMKMVEDLPEDFLSELFQAQIFPHHPLGLPIEGTKKTVRTFNHETTKQFHSQFFTPKNMVVAAAGQIKHAEIVELAKKFFTSNQSNSTARSISPNFVPAIAIKQKRDLEQAHLILATPFVDARSEQRYAAGLLANIIGGGTSSRLWQSVREKRGLAYSVGASALSFQDCGIFNIYAATSPDKLGKVLDLSITELRRAVRQKVTQEEVKLVKEQAVASILLGLESTSVRAGTLAQLEMVHGRQISLEETLQNIEAVTVEEIQELARQFFQTEKIAFGALGNLSGLKISRERLEV